MLANRCFSTNPKRLANRAELLPMFEADRNARERQQSAATLLETVGMSHRAGQLPTVDIFLNGGADAAQSCG